MGPLSLLVVGVALAGTAAISAQAFCPTTAAGRQSFVLTGVDERISLKVRPLPEDQVSTESYHEGKLVRTVVYDRGFFPEKAINGSAVTTYTYEGRTADFRFRPGDRATYVLVARTSGHGDQITRVEMTVTGSDEIEIGTCRYPVVVIERVNSYSNGSSNIVLAFFSPDLNVPLRTRIRWAKGQQSDHEYRSIAIIDD